MLSATTVSCSPSCWLTVQALLYPYHRGRISLDTTRSVSEGLVAKLEQQAADATDADGADEEPAENGGDEDEDEDDSDEVRLYS